MARRQQRQQQQEEEAAPAARPQAASRSRQARAPPGLAAAAAALLACLGCCCCCERGRRPGTGRGGGVWRRRRRRRHCCCRAGAPRSNSPPRRLKRVSRQQSCEVGQEWGGPAPGETTPPPGRASFYSPSPARAPTSRVASRRSPESWPPANLPPPSHSFPTGIWNSLPLLPGNGRPPVRDDGDGSAALFSQRLPRGFTCSPPPMEQELVIRGAVNSPSPARASPLRARGGRQAPPQGMFLKCLCLLTNMKEPGNKQTFPGQTYNHKEILFKTQVRGGEGRTAGTFSSKLKQKSSSRTKETEKQVGDKPSGEHIP
ncbi:dapper homolog 3-like [Hemicordylus capensis]|uniref:dapper homolog 3-like n=1 Tax=Hemicordylus capensis TaxID=884348 RepID=UPI0023028E38|nr:dapper homolog 3-like [Hemicordylus capensis]XP_053127722.1 dapper homolog 3-like [Hemicordylus capensis]